MVRQPYEWVPCGTRVKHRYNESLGVIHSHGTEYVYTVLWDNKEREDIHRRDFIIVGARHG